MTVFYFNWILELQTLLNSGLFNDAGSSSEYKVPNDKGVWGRGDKGYSSCSFLTTTLDSGWWSASRPGRTFTPGKGPRYAL